MPESNNEIDALPEPPADLMDVRTPDAARNRPQDFRSLDDAMEAPVNLNRLREKEEKMAIIEGQHKEGEAHKKNELLLIAGTQLGISVLAGAIVVAILYIVNPPLTQNKATEENVKEGQSWQLVLLVFAIVVFVVFILASLFKVIRYIYENRKKKIQ